VHPVTQAERLASFGAARDEVEELGAYLRNDFDLAALGPDTVLPLPDEPFVATWQRWAEEARERGAVAVLAEHLPQLSFPIAAGMSESAAYRAATRRGVPPAALPEATGLPLARPELVSLELYASPAGRIPVVVARGRAEFTALVRALARKNEPAPVPDSQGALIVSGYTNWTRLGDLRRSWEALDPAARETAAWDEELARLRPHRDLYQDRFVLLSDGPYSGVPAADLGLEDDAWRRTSLVIRRDHECAHYFTRRLFGSMRNHVLDELIADWAGLVAARGRFRADWFRRFLGIEDLAHYRNGARLDLYRGDPPLSDGAFSVLQRLVAAAAETLERFDRRQPEDPRSLSERALTIAALASLSLDRLAGADGDDLLERTLVELRDRLGWTLSL
jgi:hypothetical protein